MMKSAASPRLENSVFEYLRKDEIKDAPLPQADRHQGRGDFTFYGHRLSSLFRPLRKTTSRLTNRLQAAVSISSFQKYSTGVRGCETPAFEPSWLCARRDNRP